ncbi:MAG TPA: phosphogluconate dehydrogenase C-terminal domain-containing protein, partial [Arthrobacter sp.]|nr:phosphogluconate dehydrogenase C-terminal domain-containing protein [Arthrobacter sp.]
WADTFGGEGAPQNVVAAIDEDTAAATRESAEAVIRTIYAPVIDVHWVTVKQLAILEPTLVETVACMIGTLLNEALHETVHTAGVPEEAAKAMLFGHVQIALTNALRGSNPFSEACEIAIQYGKDTIIKDDWKKIFDDSELDGVIAKMLKLDAVKR